MATTNTVPVTESLVDRLAREERELRDSYAERREALVRAVMAARQTYETAQAELSHFDNQVDCARRRLRRLASPAGLPD